MSNVLTPAFRAWFGDSKVIGPDGLPLVVYHGTAIPKQSFRRSGGACGVGAYFADSKEVAQDYAECDAAVDGEDPILMEVYLAIRKPVLLDVEQRAQSQSITAEARDQWERRGCDGVLTCCPEGNELVAFRPEQIKCAVRNSGRYDPASPSILD